MIEAHLSELDAAEAMAVEHDRKIVAEVTELRVAMGKPRLTPDQEQQMLRDRATKRTSSHQ
jgi:hypothetical protein